MCCLELFDIRSPRYLRSLVAKVYQEKPFFKLDFRVSPVCFSRLLNRT